MNFKQCREWIDSHLEFFMDAVRIYLGAGLFLKGVSFLAYPELLSKLSLPGGLEAIVPVVPYIHLAGGLLLVVGVFTRLAALVQLPVLAGALFLVHLPMSAGLQVNEGVQFTALVLFLLSLIFLRGEGPLSLSRNWFKKPEEGNSWTKWVQAHPDFFFDMIRIYLGVALFLKGISITVHRDDFLQMLNGTSGSQLLIMVAAHYVIPVHIIGGLMLMFGTATRLAAIAQIPVVLGALLMVHLPTFGAVEMRENFEFTALMLFLLTLLSVHGSGRLSLDHYAARQEAAELEAKHAH